MLYNYEYFTEKKVNKIDLKIVYDKYYTEIDFETFQEIVSSDPTSTIDGQLYMGKYSKWLLKLYTDGKLKVEDLYKVEEYVLLFDKQSIRNKLPVNKRNIMNYGALGNWLNNFHNLKVMRQFYLMLRRKIKTLLKSLKILIYTYQEPLRIHVGLGKGTEWCTATEKMWF